MSQDDNFHEKLEAVLVGHLPDCKKLIRADRLSGGASQETYRLLVETSSGEKRIAMRRAPGGEYQEITPQHPGLPVEALLMQSARAVGVPEPEVYHVLTRDDDLGDGFIMEWLEGEALGARIVRSPGARMAGTAFMFVMKPKFPTRLFTDEALALEWLRERDDG